VVFVAALLAATVPARIPAIAAPAMNEVFFIRFDFGELLVFLLF
jgi:hypothetical protein